MLGDKLSAEQAEAWGLIWKCAEDAELMSTVRSLASQFAAGPTLGYAKTKQAVYAAEGHALAQQLDLERDLQRDLGRTRDFQEGVRAFLEKRPARFAGR
jgi:2-(1,2-epoxy-1,2-dihydrophenyl)acetyl-CoA isomerase